MKFLNVKNKFLYLKRLINFPNKERVIILKTHYYSIKCKNTVN